MRRQMVGWLGVAAVLAVLAATDVGPCLAKEAGGTAMAAADSGPFTMEAAWQTLKTRFLAGGTTMWAILFASTIGLASLLERLFRMRRGVFAPVGLAAQADKLWKEGKFDELEALAVKRKHSTLGKILIFIVRKREAPLNVINEAVAEIAGRDFTTHQMFAYPMVAVATICPLFGLLGTVLGIIDTFEMIAIAGTMGDPSIMAAGISKALVCTAFGLVVAIPMLFIYHLIKLRTQYLNRVLEEEASFLVGNWYIKGKEVGV